MPAYLIPVNRLSAEALRGVIEEFITRKGTDYGEIEVSLETGFMQVRQKLQTGSAVLVYDDESETTNILPADSPIVIGIRETVEGK
jgi:uncharacterized protein